MMIPSFSSCMYNTLPLPRSKLSNKRIVLDTIKNHSRLYLNLSNVKSLLKICIQCDSACSDDGLNALYYL